MISDVLVPVGYSFKTKVHALINALVELRIENDYAALKIPGPVFGEDAAAFTAWAINMGYLKDYEDEVPENPKKDNGGRPDEDQVGPDEDENEE